MKLTAAFLALTTAQHGIEGDHHENGMGIQSRDEVVNENNIRPDGQVGSNYNQVTRSPTKQSLPAPSFDNLHVDTEVNVVPSNNWSIDSGDDCELVTTNNGYCVQDVGRGWSWTYNRGWQQTPNGRYTNNDYCRFSYEGEDTLQIQQFDLEQYYDWMTVNGQKYDRLVGEPAGWRSHGAIDSQLAVSGTTQFVFDSDEVVAKKGFRICQSNAPVMMTVGPPLMGNTEQIDEQEALNDMPTASPTAFPTKIRADAAAVGGTHAVNWGWEIQSQTRDNPGTYVCNSYGYSYWYGYYCRSSTYVPGTTETGPTANVCHVELSEDGECISDGAGNYDNRENCKFTFTPQGQGDESILEVQELSTEYYWDNLFINGRRYTGAYTPSNAPMNGMKISQRAEFEFMSDSSSVSSGFKFCVRKPKSKGSVCTSSVAWSDGSTTRPVGWVGAGPQEDYCNIYKCEVGQSEFTEGSFKKTKRTCSVDHHLNDDNRFCSHTTCTFVTNAESDGKQVIMVHSDHREETGGYHQCGFSKHNSAFNAPSRPACDCICSGARRQDKLGFARSLNDIAAMANKAIAKSNLPTDITMKFKMNDRQQFEGSMDNIITDYDESWYLGWGLYIHWYEPIGTCAIEKYMDTTNPGDLGILHDAWYNIMYLWHNSLGLKEGNNMAWHVNNNDSEGNCQMKTKELFTPPKPDEYHMCQFTAEITDLDLKRGRKEKSDQICFSVLDENDKVLQKRCQKNDIGNQKKAIQKKTLMTKFIDMPLGGVRVQFDAITNAKTEHWFADNLKVKCKRSVRMVDDTHDATLSATKFDKKFNTNNFYSQHNNIDRSDLAANNANSQANQLGASFLEGKTYQAQHQQYSENDHTYNGQRVAHFHQDN